MLDFITPVVQGHGRGKRVGTCLVLEPHVFYVVSLQRVSLFEYLGCARAWTRQAPWYVPCAGAACVVCREFAAFSNV